MTPVPESGLDRFSLAGRVVLVTGATRGLGLEIARGMAAAGAVVGINGRDAKRADEVAKELPGGFASAFDITDLVGATDAVDTILARYGRLHCPVHKAGGGRSASRGRDPGRRLSPPDRDQPGRAVRALARRRAAHGGARSGPAPLHQLDGRAAVVPGRSGLYRLERRARGADARARG